MNIIGQDRVIKEINKIFDIFTASEAEIRPHFILTGGSGTGKSFIIETLCKQKDLKCLEINAAQITKEGTAGNSISKALGPLKNMNGKNVIVFVDEFDKLFVSNNSNSSITNEITVGVQNEFLKVLESKTASVYDDYGKYANIDISRILFIFAGAFNNEQDIDLDRLRDFGIKTEFLGRVGLVYNTDELTLEELYQILESNSLLEKYLELFQEVDREEVIGTIKIFLEDNYKNNTLGARVIHTLINQYFIKGGKLGFKEAKEITFQSKLKL